MNYNNVGPGGATAGVGTVNMNMAIGANAIGQSGKVLVSSGYNTTWQIPSPFDKRLDQIEARLLILNVDEELQNRFPALKEAYDHYKLVEKIVNDKQPKANK